MAAQSNAPGGQTRRDWLRAAPAAAAPLGMALHGPASARSAPAARPNLVLIISDQLRWDAIGAMGLNPMNLTPNIDAMARRGALFRNAFAAQPVCAPARASIFTGQYPSRHGVWKNELGLREDAATLAGALRQAGYSANYIGKWHLAPNPAGQPQLLGPVEPNKRGGFLDLWEASNVLELTSHPYEGDLYDNEGRPLHFSGQYRVDFLTSRAQRFLRSARPPFFLTVSYLEVHHQNDVDRFVPPKEFEGRYAQPYVPPDLRPLPGSWPTQLADYFACVVRIDEAVGSIRGALAETGLADNTIVALVSDHGCHFKTRNTEYKRSPHESSIHIPLILEGPGFNRSAEVSHLVSQVDLAPSLLAACGAPPLPSIDGRSFLPLLDGETGGWRDEVYFQMAEFVTGRGLRTPQYAYAAAAPKEPDWQAVPFAPEYTEYILYDLYADPYQHVNLIGRAEYREVAQRLRARLTARIQEAGGPPGVIHPCVFPYC